MTYRPIKKRSRIAGELRLAAFHHFDRQGLPNDVSNDEADRFAEEAVWLLNSKAEELINAGRRDSSDEAARS